MSSRRGERVSGVATPWLTVCEHTPVPAVPTHMQQTVDGVLHSCFVVLFKKKRHAGRWPFESTVCRYTAMKCRIFRKRLTLKKRRKVHDTANGSFVLVYIEVNLVHLQILS